MHLRTLLLALLCTATFGTAAEHWSPVPAAAPPGRVALRAGDPPPQPFLAGLALATDAGAATAPALRSPRHDPARRARPQPSLARSPHRTDALEGFVVALRRARYAGLARFGGTPPPLRHA